jgi:hypothetical protein
LRTLLIQQIADLSNIFAQIVDFACNLVRILDWDFIVELLVDPNLDRALSDFASNLGGSADLYTPIHPPPPPPPPDPPLWFIVKNLTQIHLPIFETINYVLECSLSFPMNEGMNACNQVLIDSCFTI